MRNLKKVLSLVLCMAVMLSVMVVGAGAAFSDQSKIKNTEAVDMCSALNIINGYEDGSFKPEGNITRAEACKMICVALNGGKEPVLGTNATPSFTDIKGHWAEGYIEYCYAEGIVAGVGGGKFDPAGNVTGSQFAKMLLIALGYRADHEKFVGNAWEVNVNVKATQKGLYEDLATMDPSVALTRDNAAQMVWNALQAKEVKYEYTLVSENGQLVSKVTVTDKDMDTLLEDKYNTVDTDETTGILTGISYNTTKEEYTYAISTLDSQHALVPAGTFTTEDDYTALLGNNVTFVVKEKTNDVYGAFAKDSVELISGLMGDIDYADVKTSPNISGSIEVDDTDYDVDTDIAVIKYTAANHKFVGETVSGLDNVKALAPYYEFSAIDWDDDDDIDLVIVYPVSFGEVTYVGSDYVRIGSKLSTDENDYVVYDGVAKEDYAVISVDTSLKNLGVITKLEKQSEKLVSYNSDTAKLGDTSYDYSTLTENDTTKDQSALKAALDKNIAFRSINGYLVWIDATSSVDLSDFVLVTGISGATGTNGYYQAELLFTDGTTTTASIKSLNGKALTDSYEIVQAAETVQADDDINTYKDLVQAGRLFTYTVSSGKYELTSMDNANIGFDKATWDNIQGFTVVARAWDPSKTASDANAKIAGDRIASDAVIFVKDGSDYSVKTGADLAKVTGSANVYFAGAEDNDNGYKYVTFAYVETGSVSSSDWMYGFITSKVDTTKDSDGTYYEFSVNGETEKLTTVDTTDLTKNKTFDEKDIIAYKVDNDGAVTDVNVLFDASSDTAKAIKACDGENINFYKEANSYTIDEDTTILYIDFSGKTVDATGNINTADQYDGVPADTSKFITVNDLAANKTVYYYANAFFYDETGTDNTLELLVVDVNNDWHALR